MEREEDAFENALLAALRLAPDGIKIGELRDRISVHTAFRAAGSGSLVFTTVHASLATDVPFRLMDLGLERYRAFDPVNIAWMAQRLLPLVCGKCSIPLDDAKSVVAEALREDLARFRVEPGDARLGSDGCEHCQNSGNMGRQLVCEFVRPSPGLLRAGADAATTRHYFRGAWLAGGGRSMIGDAFKLVRSGTVALDAFTRNVASLDAASPEILATLAADN